MQETPVNDRRLHAGVDGGYFAVGMLGRAVMRLDQVTGVAFEAIVELTGDIEPAAMEEAWSAVRDLHPILRCSRGGGIWQEDEAGEGPASLAVNRSEGGWRLTLTADHVAFDGVASVILLDDLRRCYLNAPETATPDWTPRNLEQVQDHSSPAMKVATASRAGAHWRTAPTSTHADPAPVPPDHPADSYHVMDLGEVLQRFDERRRHAGWSAEAVLVGIIESAWATVFGAPEGQSVWMLAQDLRPDIGIDRGLGNLSVVDAVTTLKGATDTAESVTAQVTGRRSDLLAMALIGAKYGSLSELVLTAALSRGRRLRYFRSLSNVGQLGDRLDDWGDATASRIYFLGPMRHPPYTSFIAAGHGDSTLVTVRTSPRWLTNEHAAALEAAALDLTA